MAERAPRRLIIPEYARLWFYNQTEKMAFRYIRSLYPISPQQTAEDITCSRLPKAGVSVNNLIVDATDCAYRYGVEDRYLNIYRSHGLVAFLECWRWPARSVKFYPRSNN